jgi:protein-disulfide isomerase
MAGQQRLKLFYVALGVIAVAGIAAILMAWGKGRPGTQVIGPVVADSTVFPGHVLGSDSAPVTITEYADFQCPACSKFAVLTAPDVRQRLVSTGRVRWIFRDFPLDGHPNSMPAHLAAACAGEQGKFWEMHDELYFNQGRWAPVSRPQRDFRAYAKAIGLDLGRYDDCVDSGRYQARMMALKEDGMRRGVNSTPTFDIGTLRMTGYIDYDSLKVLVDQAAVRAR